MKAIKITSDGEWLDEAAAASFVRMRAAGMPSVDVTEAGRTWERQNYLHTQYVNRVPGFNFALPPGQSKHERGNAIDAANPMRAWLVENGREHGWRRTNPNESWHFEYEWWNDKHRNDAVVVPKPITPIDKDGFEMAELSDLRKIVREEVAALLKQERVFIFRCKDGRIGILNGEGFKVLTPGEWQTWHNLGYSIDHDNMDVGPFDAIYSSTTVAKKR